MTTQLERDLAAALAQAVRLDNVGACADTATRRRWALLLAEAEVPVSGFAAGVAGSALAATKWDEDQAAAVDRAILRAALTYPAGFTADDVWAELPANFPVTKGLASRLMAQARRGAIVRTLRTVTSKREGTHGRGQRLAVWQRVPHEAAG